MTKMITKMTMAIMFVLVASQISYSGTKPKNLGPTDWAIQNVRLVDTYYNSQNANLNELAVLFNVTNLGMPFFAAYRQMVVKVTVTYHYSYSGGHGSVCYDNELIEKRYIVRPPLTGSKEMDFRFDSRRTDAEGRYYSSCKDVHIEIIAPIQENEANNEWECNDGCCSNSIGNCRNF